MKTLLILLILLTYNTISYGQNLDNNKFNLIDNNFKKTVENTTSRPKVGEYVTNSEGNYISGELPPGETHESMKPKKVSRKNIDADREMICDGTSCKIVPKIKQEPEQQESGVKSSYGIYQDNFGVYRYTTNDGYGDWIWDGISWVRNIPVIPIQHQQYYNYNYVVVPQYQYYYVPKIRRPRFNEYNYSVPTSTYYNYTPTYGYSGVTTNCPTCSGGT